MYRVVLYCRSTGTVSCCVDLVCSDLVLYHVVLYSTGIAIYYVVLYSKSLLLSDVRLCCTGIVLC